MTRPAPRTVFGDRDEESRPAGRRPRQYPAEKLAATAPLVVSENENTSAMGIIATDIMTLSSEQIAAIRQLRDSTTHLVCSRDVSYGFTTAFTAGGSDWARGAARRGVLEETKRPTCAGCVWLRTARGPSLGPWERPAWLTTHRCTRASQAGIAIPLPALHGFVVLSSKRSRFGREPCSIQGGGRPI